MMKSLSILIAVICFTFLLGSFKGLPLDPPVQKNALRTIIVDAGHGGSDRGANGDFAYEKDITLDIALKVGKRLEQAFPDSRILYTRTTDTYPTNPWRADFANKNGGDLFLSIHVNAMPPIRHTRYKGTKKQAYYTGKGKNRKKKYKTVPVYDVYFTPNPRKGTETYIWAADRTDEKEEFVGEQVYDSTEFIPDLNDPEFKARALLWTKKHFDKSFLLASMVEEEFSKAGRESMGVKQRNWKGIWVLQATAMPSILVETGFITNSDEERYLTSEAGSNEVADNVFMAVKRYKETLESRNAPTSGNKPAASSKTPAPGRRK